MAWNTLQEIRDEVYDLLWEPSDSTDEYASTRIDDKINIYQDLAIKWHIKSELEDKTYTAPDLRFMRKKSYLTRHSSKKLTTEVVTTDVTIAFDATNFEDSWYIMIEWDVIAYTWNDTTNWITWVTEIDTTHAAGKEIRQVYLIPATAWKMFGLEYITAWVPSDSTFVDEIDFRSNKDFNKYYTVVWNNDSVSSQFIDVHWYSNNERFIIHYYNLSTDMEENDDTTDLPQKYGKFVLAPIVAWTILYFTDEVELGKSYLIKWYASLETMYGQYADQVKSYKPYIKSKSINQWNNVHKRYRNY